MTDMVEVIRCRDCKHFSLIELEIFDVPAIVCQGQKPGMYFTDGPLPDDYCSWAERRDTE